MGEVPETGRKGAKVPVSNFSVRKFGGLKVTEEKQNERTDLVFRPI